jgi:hypothetical protein
MPNAGRLSSVRTTAFYAPDDWHVTSRLTLNLGLSYEFTLPPVNLLDQYSDFSPTTPNPAVNNDPGALIFACCGPGYREQADVGARLVWIAPRLPLGSLQLVQFGNPNMTMRSSTTFL